MPDRIEKLRGTLNELETELRDLDQLDEPTREMLAEAADEIAAILRRGERTERTEQVESTLRDRLAGFEASHPHLAGIMHRLIDGLGQLGI
jgi:hypothetical protein